MRTYRLKGVENEKRTHESTKESTFTCCQLSLHISKILG